MKIFANPDASLKSRHGQYQIAVMGNIVAVSAEGTASKTAVERYSRDMIEVISGFQGKKWAFLGFLHGSAILTKDAEVELQKSVAWRAEKGMALSALVTGNTTIESMVKAQFERIYKHAGVHLSVFKNEEQAMEWLAREGYTE